jgi:hypothetical protein
MRNFRIFTESGADIKFISDYVEEIFGTKLNAEDFDTLGSHSGYKNGGILKQSIRENNDDGKTTILILDADNDFAARREEVLRDFQSYNIPVHLFLFPNNLDAGNLEDMLTQIAVNRQIIECFSQYEQCIQGYQLPATKARIFAYLDALLPARNKKNNSKDLLQPENRNYHNAAHWNLHHEYLKPLHEFLKPFFP